MQKLAFYDVADVEAFCNATLEQQLKRWGSTLSREDREDILQHVLLDVWRASQKFGPGKGSFERYARGVIPRSAVSWYRQQFLDTRNERRYTPDQWERIKQVVFAVSFDTPVDRHPDSGGAGTVGDVVAVPDRRDETDSDSALARADRERDRFRARDHARLREALLTEDAA